MTRYVLITRHPSDCQELAELLEPHGIALRPYPVLRLEDSHDAEAWSAVVDAGHDHIHWLVLASPRAPSPFAEACRRMEMSSLLELPAAAVGSATAAAARETGMRVELVGPGHGAGLAQALIDLLEKPSTLIFACGHDRRPELPRALAAAGHRVLPVEVYRMRPTPPRELPPLGPSLDAVVLTSPRSARLYLDGVGGLPLPCPHIALGPTTRDAAAAMGIECRIPDEPTMPSLAEELCTI
jgi:uroporphyrinogen-III synthase